MRNRTTLTPRSLTIRDHQQQKVRDAQKSEMDTRRVNTDQNAYNSSVAASRDDYMTSALAKVRQSDVTHSETLTKWNGSWLINQTMQI